MQNANTRFNEVEYETKLAPAVPWEEGCPVINGPEIYGASPGKDFLYLIPTVGERPLRFSADNLPAGLTIEKDNGQSARVLQNSSDPEAGYDGHKGPGYQVQISQAYDTGEEGPGLIERRTPEFGPGAKL